MIMDMYRLVSYNEWRTPLTGWLTRAELMEAMGVKADPTKRKMPKHGYTMKKGDCKIKCLIERMVVEG